jgi:all-trans-retinol dehydrogenase (NAD+)
MIPVAQLLEVLWSLVLTLYHVIERLVKIVLPQKMFEKNISGQVVLVTGGGSGIGRLMCLRFARLGATVVTWDINKLGNEETVDMIKKEGNRAFSYTVDMSSKEDIYRTAEKTKEDVGPVTILVNNAGIVSGTTVLDTPDSKIVKTFEVNILAHFWTIKAFLPDMIKHKLGHIVNVASLAGHSGTNKLVDYCSSKFAAVGMDEAFRVEMFVQGHSDYIKTTVVCPYYISTGMFAGVQSKLIPILVPEYVADSVVSATLTNREVLLLPWWAFILIALKAVIPEPGFMRLSQAFGFNCSMDQFEGRVKKE